MSLLDPDLETEGSDLDHRSRELGRQSASRTETVVSARMLCQCATSHIPARDGVVRSDFVASSWETLLDRRSSCIQRARAAVALIEIGVRRSEFANRAGLSRTRLAHLVKLLALPPAVITFLERGTLSQGHGEVLAAQSARRAEELAREALAHGWSVRELERRAKGKATAGDADTKWLKRLLEDHFACPVDLAYEGRTGAGALTLRFSSLEELDGVLAKCGLRIEQ